MKQVSMHIYLILLLYSFYSCGSKKDEHFYHYECDKNISDKKGTPKTSDVLLLPNQVDISNNLIKQDITLYYSNILHCFNENILYNCYTDTPTVRILIIESWKPIKVINFKKSNKNILITKKEFLSSNYSFVPVLDTIFFKEDSIFSNSNFNITEQIKSYSLKIKVLNNNWDIIENKMDKIVGLNSNYENSSILDGSRVLLEYHTINTYFFTSINYFDTKQDKRVKEICDYLLSLIK